MKKKLNKLDIVLMSMALLLIIYTVAALIIFVKTGNEPSALTTCFFSAFGLEAVMTAWIKTTKTKHRGDDDDCN